MPPKKTAMKGDPIQKSDAPFELTMPDLLVLSLLSERAMHGYELLREFDQQEVTEWASVSRPHVYYALQKLARLGLILEVADTTSSISARSRAVFEVSTFGKKKLSEKLSESEWSIAKSPSPFSTWFGLSIHTRSSARRKIIAKRVIFLTSEIERKTQTIEFIRTYKSERAQTGVELVQLYIEQCRTELRWIETLASN
jgi:DNA-binding PadR family transcriptional regulator